MPLSERRPIEVLAGGQVRAVMAEVQGDWALVPIRIMPPPAPTRYAYVYLPYGLALQGLTAGHHKSRKLLAEIVRKHNSWRALEPEEIKTSFIAIHAFLVSVGATNEIGQKLVPLENPRLDVDLSARPFLNGYRKFEEV